MNGAHALDICRKLLMVRLGPNSALFLSFPVSTFFFSCIFIHTQLAVLCWPFCAIMFFFMPTNELQSVVSRHVNQSINQSINQPINQMHDYVCMVSTVRDLLRKNGHPTISK